MSGGHDQKILSPDSLTEALLALRQQPGLTVCAGNTFLSTNPYARHSSTQDDLLSIARIDELKRTLGTNRYAEFGAMVSLDKMLHLQGHLVPPGLRAAILSTVPYPARGLATIGGNLSINTEILNLLPFLAAWDARLDIRRQGSNRFLQASTLCGRGPGNFLEAGEILTRIRLPLSRWNHQVYHRINGEARTSLPDLALVGLARLSRDSIEELRIAWAFSNHRFHFSMTVDASLAGQRLPIPERDLDHYLDDAMEQLRGTYPIEFELLGPRLRGLAGQFLSSLPPAGPFTI